MKRTTLKKATTGLAGAIAIAGGSHAYGAIVSVTPPANLTNTPGGGGLLPNSTTFTGTFGYWDVNGDGTNDFLFTDRYPNSAAGSYGVVWQENMNAPTTALAATNGIVSYAGAFIRYGSALAAGVSIATGGAFSTVYQCTLGSRYSNGSSGVFNYGGFATGPGTNQVAPGTFGYVGFRFNAADGTHYGWIRLAINAGTITFANAAYQSTPNTAILTGAVPEPGTLAALAVGAVAATGVAIKRRRSRTAA